MDNKIDHEDLELASMSTYQLVDLLDKSYPPQCISPGETLESAWRYAGIRALVEELLAWKQDELENPRE